jgi:hypothetical protein
MRYEFGVSMREFASMKGITHKNLAVACWKEKRQYILHLLDIRILVVSIYIHLI